MQYPLISEYIDAIRSAEDNFDKLTNLRPVLDSNGNPVMSSGNFAVVFKMKDVFNDRLFAVKCFIKEQEQRSEYYRLISEELNYVSSPYLLHVRYLERELFVCSEGCDEEEFPAVNPYHRVLPGSSQNKVGQRPSTPSSPYHQKTRQRAEAI